jgi:hypothetical protein
MRYGLSRLLLLKQKTERQV